MTLNMAAGREEDAGTRGPGVEIVRICRASQLPPFVPTSQASHNQACLAYPTCCLCNPLALYRCALGLLSLPVDLVLKAQTLPSQSMFVGDEERRGTTHPTCPILGP